MIVFFFFRLPFTYHPENTILPPSDTGNIFVRRTCEPNPNRRRDQSRSQGGNGPPRSSRSQRLDSRLTPPRNRQHPPRYHSRKHPSRKNKISSRFLNSNPHTHTHTLSLSLFPGPLRLIIMTIVVPAILLHPPRR